MRKFTTKRPPNKLSALLQLALRDLKKCEKQPEYEVDMATWHERVSAMNICYVCLAGAVMAQTLGVGPGKTCLPSNFSDEWKEAFFRIDNCRGGIPSYHHDRNGFIKGIEKKIVQLKKKGL